MARWIDADRVQPLFPQPFPMDMESSTLDVVNTGTDFQQS
jgi:hypothetical protein